MKSHKEVKEFFFELEKEGAVFKYKYDDISYYSILRFPLEVFYRSSFNHVGKPSLSLYKRIVNYIKLKYENLSNNQSNYIYDKDFEESDLLFVSTCPRVDKEGNSEDLDDIYKYYKSKGRIINYVQPNYRTSKVPIKDNSKDYILPINTLDVIVLGEEAKSALKELLNYMSEFSGINFQNGYKSFLRNCQYHLGCASQLEKAIKQTKAKIVFVRSLYTEPWVAIACKRTGSDLVEVQHGVVGIHQVYFQSPAETLEENKKNYLFPDYLLTIGKEWEKIFKKQKLGIKKENVLTLGRGNYRVDREVKRTKRITFFLQPGYFNDWFSIDQFITSFIDRYIEALLKSNYSISIRPHPNSNIGDYLKFEREGVSIENPRVIPILESTKSADFIIGATTMVLYEGLSFGKKVISFKKYKPMIEDDCGIQIVESESDLFDLIQQNYEPSVYAFLSEFDHKVLDELENFK